MNIYDYFISPDIAAYCQEIRHEFNPLEMAVLVAISEKTVKEKHDAWHKIIAEYPDMPIPKCYIWFSAKESLRAYLLEFMEWENQQLLDFVKPEKNKIFLPRIYWHPGKRKPYRNPIGYHSTFESALEYVRLELDAVKDSKKVKDENGYLPLDYIQIEWVPIIPQTNDPYELPKLINTGAVTVNPNGEIISPEYGLTFDQAVTYQLMAEGNEQLSKQYEDIIFAKTENLTEFYIHIPAPFAKGDILQSVKSGKPYVLNCLPHWHKDYDKWVDGTEASNVWFLDGYQIDKNGKLDGSHESWMPPFYKLQYFKGELQGLERFLYEIQNFLNGTDKNECICCLISQYEKFKAEYTAATIEKDKWW